MKLLFRDIITGAFLGTPFRLRDDIPRDSVTPGLTVLFVWDVTTAGRVCAGTGFTLFRGAGEGYFTYITGPRDYPESRLKPPDKSRQKTLEECSGNYYSEIVWGIFFRFCKG